MKKKDAIDNKFLQRENRQLRLELREAKSINKMHKEALSQLSSPHIHANAVISILLNLLTASSQPQLLPAKNEQIRQLESELMLLEKIAEQSNASEKETEDVLAFQYGRMRQKINQLSNSLFQFQKKIGQVDYLSGLVVKYREILSPTEQNICLKKEMDELKDCLIMQKKQIQRLKEERNKLAKINIVMKDEVEGQRQEIRNMTTILNYEELEMGKNERQDGNILGELAEGFEQSKKKAQERQLQPAENLNNTIQPSGSQKSNKVNQSLTLNNSRSMNMSRDHNYSLNTFIKLQRQIIKQEEDKDDFGSENSDDQFNQCPELNVLFPDKVKAIKKKREQSKVPYLSMMKVRDMMAKREDKIKKQMDNNSSKKMNPTEKIIKLELEIDISRKETAHQTLRYRELLDENKKMKEFNEELQNRNGSLVLSYQRLNNNFQKLLKQYQQLNSILMQKDSDISNRRLLSQTDKISQNDDKIDKKQQLIHQIFAERVLPQRSQSMRALSCFHQQP